MPFQIPQSSILENGTLLAVHVTATQTICNNFLSGMAVDGNPLIIANKVYNQPLPPHYVTNINQGVLVTSLTVEPIIATQRRRLGR